MGVWFVRELYARFKYMIQKVCSKCHSRKITSEFYVYKNKCINPCKECQRKANQLRRTGKVILYDNVVSLSEIVNGKVIIEEWKPIIGYEGLYEVSNFGRIKSLKRKLVPVDKILKLQTTIYGYYHIALYDKAFIPRTLLVHILVAKHFIDNPEKKPEVNHLFGDKKDSRAWNLEWVTKLENVRHAFSTGLVCHKGEKNANHVLSKDQVIEIFNSNLPLKTLSTIYGVESHTICQIKTGYRWGHLTGKKHIKRRMLSESDVIEIIKAKLSPNDAAKKYNVPVHIIYQLKNRKTFKHLFY